MELELKFLNLLKDKQIAEKEKQFAEKQVAELEKKVDELSKDKLKAENQAKTNLENFWSV